MVDRIGQLVDQQIYDAMSAVNMEFLAQKPLNQSGIAKEADRDESSNFVHSVAEDLVSVTDWVYYVINEYRYSGLISDRAQREAMLPAIPVPEKVFVTKV